MALSVNSTTGDITALLAMSLQKTIFRPNIVYAAAIARCPESLSFILLSKVHLFYLKMKPFVKKRFRGLGLILKCMQKHVAFRALNII